MDRSNKRRLYYITPDVLRSLKKLDREMAKTAKVSGHRNYFWHTLDRVLRAGLLALKGEKK